MSQGSLFKKLILVNRTNPQLPSFRTQWQPPSSPSARRLKSYEFGSRKEPQANYREVNTCTTDVLKPPKMNTCVKTGRGEGSFCNSDHTAHALPAGEPEAFAFSRSAIASQLAANSQRMRTCGNPAKLCKMNTYTIEGVGGTRSGELHKLSRSPSRLGSLSFHSSGANASSTFPGIPPLRG